MRTSGERDSVLGPSDLMLDWVGFCGRVSRLDVGWMSEATERRGTTGGE